MGFLFWGHLTVRWSSHTRRVVHRIIPHTISIMKGLMFSWHTKIFRTLLNLLDLIFKDSVTHSINITTNDNPKCLTYNFLLFRVTSDFINIKWWNMSINNLHGIQSKKHLSTRIRNDTKNRLSYDHWIKQQFMIHHFESSI